MQEAGYIYVMQIYPTNVFKYINFHNSRGLNKCIT